MSIEVRPVLDAESVVFSYSGKVAGVPLSLPPGLYYLRWGYRSPGGIIGLEFKLEFLEEPPWW